jgi:hypothetical protein
MITSRSAWSSRSGPFHLRRFARRIEGRDLYFLREWQGRESLDVTFACLTGSDEASEPVQEQVASGALAPAARGPIWAHVCHRTLAHTSLTTFAANVKLQTRLSSE